MARSQSNNMGKLILGIAVFVFAGIPMVAYVWETINQIMTGHFNATRSALAAGVTAVLLAWLGVLARTLAKWEGELK